MGKKPVVGLIGCFWLGVSLTGCDCCRQKGNTIYNPPPAFQKGSTGTTVPTGTPIPGVPGGQTAAAGTGTGGPSAYPAYPGYGAGATPVSSNGLNNPTATNAGYPGGSGVVPASYNSPGNSPLTAGGGDPYAASSTGGAPAIRNTAGPAPVIDTPPTPPASAGTGGSWSNPPASSRYDTPPPSTGLGGSSGKLGGLGSDPSSGANATPYGNPTLKSDSPGTAAASSQSGWNTVPTTKTGASASSGVGGGDSDLGGTLASRTGGASSGLAATTRPTDTTGADSSARGAGTDSSSSGGNGMTPPARPSSGYNPSLNDPPPSVPPTGADGGNPPSGLPMSK